MLFSVLFRPTSVNICKDHIVAILKSPNRQKQFVLENTQKDARLVQKIFLK